MPHQSDSIVMQLRGAIMLDEKDLLGPLPPSACSSLDDGPFCARLGLGGVVAKDSADRSLGAQGAAAPSFLSLADLQGSGSAQYVVDGVLSNWMQAQNKEAFDWSPDTLRTFSNLVSRVISDSLGSAQDVTRQASATGRQQATPMARTGSQCFRLAFDRLLPGSRFVPSNFTAGLPKAISASWEGVWEAEAVARRRVRSSAPSWRRAPERRADLEAAPQPPWATQVVLTAALGYIRFAQPLVVRRLLIGVPPASVAGELWGRGGLVCGRLKGREQWCVALDQVAASAHSSKATTEDHAGGESEGVRWADVGNSINAVDEVAFVAAPSTGLAVGLIEVVATLPSHPLHGLPAQRRVVLLRPSRGKEAGNVVEPTLTVVSRDAAIWDMNEVMRHHMLLRRPGASGRRVARSAGPVKKELQSFQEMLQGLKAGKISPPTGVTFARLRREVSALVASTKKIQDDDVLLHSKIESLLQQRLREKGLDGLLALQAAWRLRAPTATSGRAAQAVPDDSPATEASKAGAASAASSAEARTDAVVPAAEDPSRRWGDEVEEELEYFSEEIERKAAEVREKAKKQKAGALEFQMDLQGGTIDLKDIARQIRALSGGAGIVAPRDLRPSQGGQAEAGAGGATAGSGAGAADAAVAAAAGEEERMGAGEATVDAQPAAAGEEAQDELPATSSRPDVDENQLAAKMSQMVAAALTQAGVGGADGAVEAAGSEALQEALQQAMAQNLEADGDGDPGKMQVHFVKLEDLAGGDGEGGTMAQMLQSLLSQQGGGMSPVSATTLTPDELRSLLQAQQPASADEEDGGEGEAEVPVDAGDVVGL